MKGKKCLKLLVLSLSAVFSWVLISCFSISDVSAASLGTSSFDLYYKPNSNATTTWLNNVLYSDYVTVQNSGSIYKYQFTTPSVQAGGNYATIHFETNIVALKFDFPLQVNPWVNLQQQNILVCNSNPSGATIISKNLSFATTPWFNYYDNNTYSTNNTLTFYGDIALSGFTMNNNYQFVCAIGSESFSFYDGTEWNSSYTIYFEQNPMTIEWSNDQSIALNQMMVNQNSTIINNQNELNDWLKDDTPAEADTSVISGASGWLPQGPVDSLLTLPMTFAQGIVDIFTGQHECTPIVLPLDFINSSLTIPCLDDFFRMSGVSLIWNGVGTIISAFVLYSTFKWLYKFVDDTLTLRENNSGLWGGL